MINDLWYKNAIIYCLSVSTYMDANGDGVGDFRGLMNRLDYLQGIGVTAIWLMPFQPSPFRDDGYDIADYYGVDPRYGTLGDFVEFTHGCRQRGIRVLIDLVVNHTSDKHPWFQEARYAQNPSIGTGMYGRRRSRNMPTMESSFLASRNPLGTMTSSRGPGTSTDSTTSSPT
jgi:maltose alpha-D-glucosyltransferase/alpha-amylase